jgi:hypothetical protein
MTTSPPSGTTDLEREGPTPGASTGDAPAGSPPPDSPDSAIEQLGTNFRLLRGAILGLGGFLLAYGVLALYRGISYAWGDWGEPYGFSFENRLLSLATFEILVVGLFLGGVAMLFRLRAERDRLREEYRQLPSDSQTRRSPLAQAELRIRSLRALSRQVDTLLLWLPLAILLSVWSGLAVLLSTSGAAITNNPTLWTLAWSSTLLGVPVAVTAFGLGTLLTMRASSRRQIRLSESTSPWWDAPPAPTGAVSEPRAGPGGPPVPDAPVSWRTVVDGVTRRGRQERRAVLLTAVATLLGMVAYVGTTIALLGCRPANGACTPTVPVASVGALLVAGIVGLGLLPPVYVGLLALRRRSHSRSAPGTPGLAAAPPARPSDAIALVQQVATLRRQTREDARDSLWLVWFSVIWILAGSTILPLFTLLAIAGHGGLFGISAGSLAPWAIAEAAFVLLPVPLAAGATVAWLRRHSADVASEDAIRTLVRGYSHLEQGFWERF